MATNNYIVNNNGLYALYNGMRVYEKIPTLDDYWAQRSIFFIEDMTTVVAGKLVDKSPNNKQIDVSTLTEVNDHIIMPANDVDIINALKADGMYFYFYIDDSTPKSVKIGDIVTYGSRRMYSYYHYKNFFLLADKPTLAEQIQIYNWLSIGKAWLPNVNIAKQLNYNRPINPDALIAGGAYEGQFNPNDLSINDNYFTWSDSKKTQTKTLTANATIRPANAWSIWRMTGGDFKLSYWINRNDISAGLYHLNYWYLAYLAISTSPGWWSATDLNNLNTSWSGTLGDYTATSAVKDIQGDYSRVETAAFIPNEGTENIAINQIGTTWIGLYQDPSAIQDFDIVDLVFTKDYDASLVSGDILDGPYDVMNSNLLGAKLCVVGDSISLGFYPVKIQHNYGFKTIYNCAKSGRRMVHDGANDLYQDLPIVVVQPADIFTILASANDGGSPIGTIDSSDDSTYLGAYNNYLTYLLANINPTKKVVLITCPFIVGAGKTIAEGKALFQQQFINMANGVKALGVKYNLPVCDLHGLMPMTYENSTVFLSDKVHWTTAMHDAGADIIGSFINDLYEEIPLQVLNAVAWHTPQDIGGESNPDPDGGMVWWDMTKGTQYLGPEVSTGSTVVGKYYYITAGSAWYFDVPPVSNYFWRATAVKTLNATHRVKEVLGNFVYQQENAKKPINAISDGSNDFMKSPTIPELVQPITSFIVARQVTWDSRRLFDGSTDDSGELYQYSSTPYIQVNAGTGLTETEDWLVGKLAIIKIVFNGVNSKYQINNCPVTTGNAGSNNMQGITYFRYGDSNLGFSNFELKEAIWDNKIYDASTEKRVFNYLRDKWFEYEYLQICTIGDSLTAEAAILLNRYGVYDITDISHAGDDIVAQQIVWDALSSTVKSSFDCIFVMLGANCSTHPVVTTIIRYQDLVNSINATKKSSARLICASIMPCLENVSWVGYEDVWHSINEAIKGGGSTPITGINTVIDMDDMGDPSTHYLSPVYDNGDHLHPSIAGRKKIAEKYSEAIYPIPITDGNTWGWYKWDDLTTITKDASDMVSAWADKLGSVKTLSQLTDDNKPIYSVNGLLFDGINDLLRYSEYFAQPCMIYALMKQVTWNVNAGLFGGGGSGAPYVYQSGSSPILRGIANTITGEVSGLAIDTWGILRFKIDGANSRLTSNNDSPATGNFDTRQMQGITIGANGSSSCANVQVKEIIVRKVVDTAENEAAFYNYLYNKKFA